MMNGGVEYPRTHSTSPSETYAPYKSSPKIDPFEQPPCLGSTFVSEVFRKSDQMHQTLKKSPLAMTRKLDDMIELPMSQSKKTYKEDLEYEVVMVKMPKYMSWLDDESIEEVDETKGIPIEVEPLDHTKLEDLCLNTYRYDISLSSREFSSVDEPEPQYLPNFPSLGVNLGDKRSPEPPIKPLSPGSFRMKVIFDEENPKSS
ncbi:hypothetical protein Tco_0825850 [Tanacetum coccineum]